MYRENCEPTKPVERERREALVLLEPGSSWRERSSYRLLFGLWFGGIALGFVVNCIAVVMWLRGHDASRLFAASAGAFSVSWIALFWVRARVVEVEP